MYAFMWNRNAYPPLCGSKPPEKDYILPPGSGVAARTSKSGQQPEWLLATVMRYVREKSKYEVVDADPDEEPQNRKYGIPFLQTTQHIPHNNNNILDNFYCQETLWFPYQHPYLSIGRRTHNLTKAT